MPPRIHRYTPSHRDSVLALLRLNTPAYFAEEEEAEFKAYLDSEIEHYFVMEMDGEVVGCGGINFDEQEKKGIISWDMFHPDFQSQGLGTQLLQHRLAILKSLNSVETIVVRTSQVAYLFYEKNGFQLKRIEKDFWAPGFDLYYMEFKSE